jgi:DNA-binding XRE family transcriptional regulator
MVNNVEEFKRIIGLNIEHKRKKAKMTQEKLAELLGVTVRSVYNYEKGKNLDMVLAYELSLIFDCTIDEFFLETNTTKSGK